VIILKNNDVIIAALLRMAYQSAVKNRCKKPTWITIPDGITNDVAHELDHPKFARLFVRAQFRAMPTPFCRVHFNRPYPPPNVVFSILSMERYRKYLERGIDDGS